MKTLYLTYTQNGKIKKAVINEETLQNYRKNSSISNIVTYPSQSLMEDNFNSMVCKDGSCTTKKKLFG